MSPWSSFPLAVNRFTPVISYLHDRRGTAGLVPVHTPCDGGSSLSDRPEEVGSVSCQPAR